MRTVVSAEGAILDRILATSRLPGTADLDPQALSRFEAAQRKTVWGRAHQRRVALVEGDVWLASARCSVLAGILDEQPVRVCAIGDVCTDPAHAGGDHARALVDRMLDSAAQEGAGLGLLFSEGVSTWDDRSGFERIATTEVELGVVLSENHGAPMTLVRAGDARDLAAIVAMGRDRATPFRFHLDRDVDFVQFAMTRKRLLAGLGPPGGRQLQFFIAEEGITAAAYVVISVVGSTWTIEECGDRDRSGARIGAILQALIAREPVERRPSIRGWLPPGLVPPQITIVSKTPSAEVMMVRSLGSRDLPLRLSGADVLYWRNDVF